MFSLGTVLDRTETLESRRPVAMDENALLAAALAATLVEYRRYVQQRSAPDRPEVGAHWRTVARVERLAGPAPFGR